MTLSTRARNARYLALEIGVRDGLSMDQIAGMLGITTTYLYRWRAKEAPWLPLPKPQGPHHPAPPASPLLVAVYPTRDGWRVDCWPCGRRFTRDRRARADWLARQHATMHGLTLTCTGPHGARYKQRRPQ